MGRCAGVGVRVARHKDFQLALGMYLLVSARRQEALPAFLPAFYLVPESRIRPTAA
jgi:hypothetical protein